MKVFAGLYAWRDNIARSEDESTRYPQLYYHLSTPVHVLCINNDYLICVRYVLPNQMMFEVAAQMPTETNSLFTCCAPVPPLVKTHAADIIRILLVEHLHLLFISSSLLSPPLTLF